MRRRGSRSSPGCASLDDDRSGGRATRAVSSHHLGLWLRHWSWYYGPSERYGLAFRGVCAGGPIAALPEPLGACLLATPAGRLSSWAMDR